MAQEHRRCARQRQNIACSDCRTEVSPALRFTARGRARRVGIAAARGKR